jgi:medium-chain acyl-[acyl-carrier-protein] hydrolase
MQLLRPILRADFTVCDTYTYVPDAPLDCSISAFGGLQDPVVTCESIAAWRDQTIGAFSMRMLAGGHFFLQTSPALLPALIGQELGRAARLVS